MSTFFQRLNADVVGGRINNTVIGGVTPAAATFTTLTSTGDATINGNLNVLGTSTAVDSVNVNVADAHLFLNNGYTTPSGKTGGLVVNRLPLTPQLTTTGAGVFTPGVAATSNPTISLSGATANTLTTGMIVQISGASNATNKGVFEVAANNTASLLTLRGIGTIATVEDFTQNQLASETNTNVTIKQVTISVLRCNSSTGVWETADGAATGLTFSASGNVSMVSNGTTTNGIIKLVASGGKVIIDSTITIDGTNQLIMPSGSDIQFTSATDNIQFNAIDVFPASSSDTGIVVWDGTTGRAIKSTAVLIDTNNNIRVDTNGRHVINSFETQTVAGGANLNPDVNKETLFVTTSGGTATDATGTLANGTFTNQRKKIIATSIAASRNYVLTVTNALFPGGAAGSRTLTFDTSGMGIELVWNGSNWLNVAGGAFIA